MPALKCPNPSCAFLFDPTQVPAGAVLACPRCGMRFTLGAAHAQPPTPARPPAADDPIFADAPPTPPPAPRRKEGGFPVLLTVGGVLLAFGVIGAVLYAAMMLKRGITHGDPGQAGGEREVVVEDKNFAYRFPGPPWAQDQETKNALGVHAFGLKRAEAPEAWAALEVSEYGTHTPGEADLRERMANQLNRVFANLPAEPSLEPATWAGQDARRCQFRAEHKTTGTVCLGEVYLLGHKGVGYWFYAWTAERDAAAVAHEFDDLRGRFRLLDRRANWSGKTGTEVVFRGPGKVNYRLTAHEAIWKKPAGLAPTDEDPEADLLLKAELKGRQQRDFPPQATVVVLVLDEGGDPAEVAGQYVRKRHTLDPEVFGPTKITEVTEDPVGDPPPGPDDGGAPTTRLKVSPGGENASRSAEKLVVYAAVKSGDAVVVAEGSCPWTQRAVWERRLIQIVGSLK